MGLNSTQKTVFRTFWLKDLFDGTTTPPTALSSYNKVKKASFFSDADLDAVYDMAIAENPRILTAWVDTNGVPQQAEAIDLPTAIYREMRKHCLQQQLLSEEFIKCLYAAGSSEQVVRQIIENMKDAIANDVEYRTNTSQYPMSILLERG